eukprot:PhF_6_TR30186/c0_g1_i2/m.44338/K11143/DNAI2; dynein intermediate chain 2, axonemal
MSELVYVYQREARYFKSSTSNITIATPMALLDVPPQPPNPAEPFVSLPYLEREINNIPELSEASTNTERIKLNSKGMVHTEGGWPGAVDVTDVDAKTKFTKRIEREDRFVGACRTLGSVVVPILRQNSAIDIYEIYTFNNSASGNTTTSSAIQAIENSTSAVLAQSVPTIKSPHLPTNNTTASTSTSHTNHSSSDGLLLEENLLVPVTRYTDQLRPHGTPLRCAARVCFGGSGEASK